MGIKEIDCYLVELGCWISYKNDIFKRNIYTPDILHEKILNERYGNTGIFKTVYAYDNPNIEESHLYGDFYLDFDNENDFEKVRIDVLDTLSNIEAVFGILSEDVQIYFSGNKGIHLIIDKKILGVIPHKKLNIVYKYISLFLRSKTSNKTIDTKIYDNKRLFRLPNTKHEKTNLFKISLTYEELLFYTHEKIKELAKNQRKTHHVTYSNNPTAMKMYNYMLEKAITEYNDLLTQSLSNDTDKLIKDTPKCITHLLDMGPVNGCRNQTLAALTSFYKTKGCSYQETINKLLEWNSGSIHQAEFYKTVRSIYTSNFKYGCRTLKDISICSPGDCPLMKGRKNNAQSKQSNVS